MVNNQRVYKKALKLYGLTSQIDITIEECSELIQALVKFKRYGTDKTVTKILDELVDATIMIEQMIASFHLRDKFYERKKYKIERLIKRLEKEETK